MTKSAKWVLGISLLSFFVAVYILGSTFTPFFVAAILAYLFDPIVNRLQRFKVPRTIAVGVVFVIIITLFTLLLFFIVPLIERQIMLLIDKLPAIISWAKSHINQFFEKFGRFNLSDKAADASQNGLKKASDFAAKLMRTITMSGMAFVSAVTNILLVPVVLFYLLRDWHGVLAGVRDLIPRSALQTVTKLMKECNEVLSAFLRGQLLVMIALAILYSVGLSIVGLDLALLIGAISGLVSIVPYLGFIVGILAASIAALFQFQDAWYLIYVAIVFLVANGIEGSLLTPMLVGDKIGLHPVAVIFAVLAGGQLFGFVGILLALPVAAVVMVFIRHFVSHYKQSDAYSSDQKIETT